MEEPDVYNRTVRRESTPRVEEGEEGIAHDGMSIPVEEMVKDVTEGAAPEALANFAENALKPEQLAELLQRLSGLPQATPHRPQLLTRGDIFPNEWLQLTALYNRLQRLIQAKVRFSALAYSTFRLLEELARHGSVSTVTVLTSIRPAYGYEDATTQAFDMAVAIVWSMAVYKKAQISSEIEDALRALIQEIEDHEAALGYGDHFAEQ